MIKRILQAGIIFTVIIFYSGILNAQRQMEKLDRGVLAIKTTSGVYVNWRIMGTEWRDASYNLYRDGLKLNAEPITGASNYSDVSGLITSSYIVKAIINGVEQEADDTASVWAGYYSDIQMRDLAGNYELNDASVGDLDGDGEYEIVVKRLSLDGVESDKYHYLEAYKLDGTFMWAINLGPNIYNKVELNFLVWDFDGDGKAEVATRTSEGTIDGTGVMLGDIDGDGVTNYRYSISAYDYRVDGPDFISIYDGQTGREIARDNYIEKDPILQWGEPGMNETQLSHRATKCMWTVAYLDGKTPSFVISRGIYHRIKLEAWNFRNNSLTKLWAFDTKDYGSAYYGSGNHNLSLADVDNDGKDEVVYASMVIDDDGTGLYATGLGHGDALHVTDIDPDRPGLEIWQALETSTGALYRDARTGEELVRYYAGRDCGRACAGDITADHRGLEFWAAIDCPIYDVKGEKIGPNSVPMNFMVWWDGDLLREFLDHDWLGTELGTGIGTISKYNSNQTVSKLLTANGTYSNNYTKGTPCLTADIFGDWREEVIWRATNNKFLRIYSTATPTTNRIYTLMHDPQYRIAVAWQNNAYNQPPHPGYYLGAGMDSVPPPPMTEAKLLWKSGTAWDAGVTTSWLQGTSGSAFTEGDDVLFDISGNNLDPVIISGSVNPSAITVYSPVDYTFEGPGTINGNTGLLKAGSGILTLNNDNTFTGYTAVWDGSLVVNASFSGSHINVKRFAGLGGKGILGNGLTLERLSKLTVGEPGSADTLKITGDLTELGEVLNYFDLSDDPSGIVKKNDIIILQGNLNLEGISTININMLNGDLLPGDYCLITYSGAFNGKLDNLKIDGIPGVGYELKIKDNSIVMEVLALRKSASIIWAGGTENYWDLVTHYNWLKNGTPDWFVPNDTVIFDDTGAANNEVSLVGLLQSGEIIIDAGSDYKFIGEGSLIGNGGLVKNGSGTLEIIASNLYTGATKINNGTIKIEALKNAGIPGPLGAASANPSNLIFDGGALLITGSGVSDRGFTLGNSGGTLDLQGMAANQTIGGLITGQGMLKRKGQGTLSILGSNNYSGGTLLKDGVIVLATDLANISGLGSGPLTFENGTLSMYDNANTYNDNCNWNVIIPTGYYGNLNLDSRCSLIGSLSGSGTLNIKTPFVRSEMLGNWSEFAGTINVTTDADGGTFILGSSLGYGKASLFLNDKVTAFYRFSVNQTVEIGALFGTSGAVLGGGGESNNTITWKVGTNNINSVFNGVISDVQYKNTGSKASLLKSGSASLTLTNANIYTGNTSIEEGTLILNNTSGSGTGTGTITVKPGGTLGGTGTVSGAVTVEGGSVISPGDNGIGYFTVDNDLTFMAGSYFAVDLNSFDKSADILIVNGKLKLAGILYLMDQGPGFSVGDNYKIFHSDNCSGSFEDIIPTIPGEGMIWDTTAMSVTGYISVAKYTGISQGIFGDQISLFPNPATGKISIALPGNHEPVSISIRDMTGRTLKELKLPGGSNREIDISKLTPGIYLVRLEFNNYAIIRKFVKK